MNNHEIMQIALQQSAIDCNCSPGDFLTVTNHVCESVASDSKKERCYLQLPHLCSLVSYGANIVASGRASILTDIGHFINQAEEPSDCFETPGIYALNRILQKEDAAVCFMADYYLPDIDAVFRFRTQCPYEVRILGPEEFADCYTREWKNALCEKRKDRDMLAAGAYENGRLIGLAGVSADCGTMWQIGVDVLAPYRKQGVASTLTNRLAREVLERGFVPFYCAAWSNVKSRKNAVRSGFCPGWVEVIAKSRAYIKHMGYEV